MPDPESQVQPRPEADLTESIYAKLRTIAQNKLAGERRDHTLQATALVHEALMKMDDPALRTPEMRGRFYLASAEAMRRILIDHARARKRTKRGGNVGRVDWSESISFVADLASLTESEDLEALDGAIRRLQDKDPRVGDVVRLRFFAGIGLEEAAAALGISHRSARRDWEYARAWLHRELKKRPTP